MFKIESYVTPILLSYVDKYVRDFKPADAQVSLWGGGVALHNLVIKPDVLQQESAFPFTLMSGRIHELLIQVPWTKIMSEPIVVTIDTIECVLSLRPPTSNDDSPPPESPSRKTQEVEAPPGYMQALVRRIVSNITVRVHHLIVKYVQDDIVLSLNVKHLSVDATGSNWQPAFADIDQNQPVIRRLVRLDDLTLCLDHCDSDGKIRFYQEPLLYRCQLDLRVLTRLVSANTRRARSLSIHLCSTKLAFGVTSDQLTLLLRLLKERSTLEVKVPSTASASKLSTAQSTQLRASVTNTAEPARTESWSEWAWSWLPTWMDREGGIEEAPVQATSTPIYFVAYLDDISLVYKVIEIESVSRKRARGILELNATHAAVKTKLCTPTLISTKVGARTLTIQSHGKCVCGAVSYDASKDTPTVYLMKTQNEESKLPWVWPEEQFIDDNIERAEPVDKDNKVFEDQEQTSKINVEKSQSFRDYNAENENIESDKKEIDAFWSAMAPQIYLEFSHERSPPTAYTNPYENPPTDFQYSDWEEECKFDICLQPMQVQLCLGLLHRLEAFWNICKELAGVTNIEPPRTLTLEERDALVDNLPQRRIKFHVEELRIRLIPWDHTAKPLPTLLVLDFHVPKANVVVTGPLYPQRVCSAACQIPDTGSLWQGARLHVTGSFPAIEAMICSPRAGQPKPCARIDVKFVLHVLLNRNFFTKQETVLFSYSLKTREVNVSGSAARLMAALHIPLSLLKQRGSAELRYTTLMKDALKDEESVALDVTSEEFAIRGYITKNVNTHILTLQSARATVFQKTGGNDLKQAWLFSAPDIPSTKPYLRMAVQWCAEQLPNSIDYVGIWTERTAFCVDPLFIAWLAYRPTVNATIEKSHSSLTKAVPSTQYFMRRKSNPPSTDASASATFDQKTTFGESIMKSSSGRGGSRPGSGAELVHNVRPRSVESKSELSDKKESKPPPQAKPVKAWLNGDQMIKLHDRLRQLLINVELGLVMVYVTMSTASAVDCATLHMSMERHAAGLNRVLAINVGRWSLYSSSATKHFWQEIKHDGPTFITAVKDLNPNDDKSFPWKLKLADVSCYTMEVRAIINQSGLEKSSSGLRSQLKPTSPTAVQLHTILEVVTTTVTLSVVTKSLQYKTLVKKPEHKKFVDPTKEEKIMKYFTSGAADFKPSTLKEFVRGPSKRTKSSADQTDTVPNLEPELKITSGPIVSFGFHVHADTPPVIVRLEHDQVHVVAAAVHCFRHILALLQRPLLVVPRQSNHELTQKTFIRSVSEIDEQNSLSESTRSESKSELISIFDPQGERDDIKIKAFFWFQWVISRAALIVATHQVKLAFDVDDIISTIDLQEHYNQLKLKVASASVRHYRKTTSNEWAAGVLGGRVLEAREPNNAKEENNFLSITITQAQISNLPDSWKEELHPKLLQQKSTVDKVWEIYATLAPLEAVLQPHIVENIMSVAKEMAPHSYCSLKTEHKRNNAWQWPYCYVSAGGLRLLVTCDELEKNADDTLIFFCGKITVNPHPENPICRRSVNTFADTGWLNVDGGFEGRQYDMLIKNVAIRSAGFTQLVNKELSEIVMIKSGENPAHKWSQPVVLPVITPILHLLDIGCVLAPALYVGDAIACGPGIELNLMSDCTIELSIEQMGLVKKIIQDMTSASERNPSTMAFDEEKHGVCAYASLFTPVNADIEDDVAQVVSEVTVADEISAENDIGVDRSVAADSGVEMSSASRTLYKLNRYDTLKSKMTVGFVEQQVNALDYLEVFVTMGTIEFSLYVLDDGSPDVNVLKEETNLFRTPRVSRVSPDPTPQKDKTDKRTFSEDEELERSGSRSLTETIRNADIVNSNLDITVQITPAREFEGHVPLMYASFYQPNLYYWRKKVQRSVQISLFNACVGLGAKIPENYWNQVLLTTSRGEPDPVTEIPPALATMKLTTPSSSSSNLGSVNAMNARGSLNLDIERPILLEISEERLMRLKRIINLTKKKFSYISGLRPESVQMPILYRIRRLMVSHAIETVTIKTSQIGAIAPLGSVGWDSASLQVSWGVRPDRLGARALVTALLVASGPFADSRQPVLQPLQLGMELDATWEAWRRAESGPSRQLPTVRIGVELDRVVIDMRPSDLEAIQQLRETIINLQNLDRHRSNLDTISQTSVAGLLYPTSAVNITPSSLEVDSDDHYYKDDLRSGAFKLVTGGQLPMAYQVTLHRNAVSWRYPHPRAITRLIVFPIPGHDKEIDCVLELYNPILSEWEPHSFFKVPVNEPSEINLHIPPPEAAFSTVWRCRVYSKTEAKTPFEFNMNKFVSSQDPMGTDSEPDKDDLVGVSEVTAEQLSGVLRVDSFFSPRVLPRISLSMRLTALELHANNSLLSLANKSSSLQGYYVSKHLMRCHRVLTVTARNATVHANFESPAGKIVLINTQLSSDIFDCATGTMDQLVDEFRVQAGISMGTEGLENVRLRFRTSNIHTMLHVPRLGTLHALVVDWKTAFAESIRDLSLNSEMELAERNLEQTNEKGVLSVVSLQGRVCLWVNNESSAQLRVGQEGTDEMVPLGPGAVLAYRWRSPTAVKKLRFAFADASNDWLWSNGIHLTPGMCRVRLENVTPGTSTCPSEGVYAYLTVKQSGANRYLNLSGRLVLANMLRFSLQFKVRVHSLESKTWRSLAAGEIAPESVGRSVICNANRDMVLKIKLTGKNMGWSGDIPLKECPKENVPWLVKVPSEGDVPYMSVWCRVVRARSDGRILATIWPLYILRSHLPLEAEVLIVTEPAKVSSTEPETETGPSAIIQVVHGRGKSVHLLAPGTTSARHSLSFQYRNIDCPVTREAVPLHYGVTDTSVFDKRTPVNNIDEVIQDILAWLERSSTTYITTWPYSIVTKHWPGSWQPALLQPRCDVSVRYQAVKAGGGCSLEVQLSPVLLLCNASPIMLTLRGHDASPLCRTEPGSAISLPYSVLQKPFFMSIETGREAFVSGQLEVCSSDPGRYGEPAPDQFVIDHSTLFTIQCNQMVTLLTMHYEIKDEINILGITAPFVLINRLNTDIMVLPSAIAKDITKEVILRHMTFKVVSPCEEGSIHGIPLCRFWLCDRWRGGNASELNLFLSLALPGESQFPASSPVPIRLGAAPHRRAIALIDNGKKSVAVVVIQHKHEGRWLVTVAPDPCPQYIVHNRTLSTLAIAQPVDVGDEPSASTTKAVPDCLGVHWCTTIGPDEVTYYSSPAHCARYPPQPDAIVPLPFLTFSRVYESDTVLHWCPPVAVADGEQLVQLHREVTAKLRVHSHQHSTLIELQEVDEHDISASDIRKRLLKPFSSDQAFSYKNEYQAAKSQIERVPTDNKLLENQQNVNEILKIYSETSIFGANASSKMIPVEVRNLDDNRNESVYRIEKMKSVDNANIKDEEAPVKDLNTNEEKLQEKTDHDDNLGNVQKSKQQIPSSMTIAQIDAPGDTHSYNYQENDEAGARSLWQTGGKRSHNNRLYETVCDERSISGSERIRCVIESIGVEMAGADDTKSLFAVHLDRATLQIMASSKKTKTLISIADIQIDNLLYDNGQFDFAVVATTRAEPLEADQWPALWNMFAERAAFAIRHNEARLLLKICNDQWSVVSYNFSELSEIDIRLGPLALYIEDAYVTAVIELFQLAFPSSRTSEMQAVLSEINALQSPLRFRTLYIHPLDLTLTLHTAVRVYIALDQSPLHLSAFQLQNTMASTESLAHALTVHYLSAAILGAGWVVGGLELLGAPGALAARVGGATGGVRGIVSAAAAALLRSLSACAGSLARNLDLLAGDEEHARRAAAARRRPPNSFIGGLAAGITNFGINMLGAVGGLAHHPLVGVAVGETESGTAALRRGLLGALTKPLSATADLVAFAGHGLLRQTGWDPIPQPRLSWTQRELTTAGWRRDCVRWSFRLAELNALAGFEVLLDNVSLQLLITHKFLVVADVSEQIVEMIDFNNCKLRPHQASIVELCVTQRRTPKSSESQAVDDDDEYQISAAAMARVARYTGAEGAATAEARVLAFLTAPGYTHALYAALAAAIHHNAESHFALL